MKKKLLNNLSTIVLILISIIFCFLYAKDRLNMKTIYISKFDIYEREIINEEYLEKIEVPYSLIYENAYLLKEDIIGKYVKANAYIPKGSLFYKELVESKEDLNDAVHLELNEDESTYDLFIKDITINPGSINKGIYVDMYLTTKKDVLLSDLLIGSIEVTGLYDSDYKEIRNNSSNKVNCLALRVKKDMIPYINKALKIGDVNLVVNGNPYKNQDVYLNKSSKVFKLVE